MSRRTTATLPRDLMSVAKAAKRVGCSEQTIRNRIKQGRLPSYGIPGERTTRVSEADVIALWPLRRLGDR